MQTIVQLEFGSTIYGTRTPTSDLDLKSVFIPDYRNIILGRVQDTVNRMTKVDIHAKNTSEDVDDEAFSLKQYLKLASEGQTVALDMLFCPDAHLRTVLEPWRVIQANKDKLIHRGAASFVGYCRTQANKYGIKGSRVAAVRSVVDVLEDWSDQSAQLYECDGLMELVGTNEFIQQVECKGPNGLMHDHIEVCNRKVPVTSTVKYAYGIWKRVLDEYGARALAAESNQGVDWKALSHAVRVASEATELLLTGNITFPCQNAALQLQIKKGEMPYKQVAELIEQGLLDVEEASKVSTLPAGPNQQWIDDFVFAVYSGEFK